MNREDLRAIAQMKQNFQLVKSISERQSTFGLVSIISGRDINTGKTFITTLDGGGLTAQSITNSAIAPTGSVIPATINNGGFLTIDAKPAIY